MTTLPAQPAAESIPTQLIAHRSRGRGYRLAFDCPVAFARDVVHLLFEPDPQCARDMAQANPSPGNVHVLPFALGDADRGDSLKITADADRSSLRAPDPASGGLWAERNFSGEAGGAVHMELRFDAHAADACRVVREQAVEVRALDSLLAGGTLPVREPPDVLSLDLPGTEYEALLGARGCLRDGVLAVTTGAAFIAQYRGQKLFGDIHAELSQAGFVFAGFLELHEAAARRLPAALRGNDLATGARCLFLRRVDSLAAVPSADLRHAMAMKLAFIALTFGHLAHALESLEAAQAATPGPELRAALGQHAYARFLEQFRAVVAGLPADFLHERVEDAAAALAARSRAMAEILSGRAGPQGWFQRKAAGALRRLQRTWIVLMGGVPAPVDLSAAGIDLPGYTPTASTALEDLLLLNGFWSVAERVRHRRARAHQFIRREA